MLRVSNATDDVSYMQWDPAFVFDAVAFHAYFDVDLDPLQQTNLWPTLPPVGLVLSRLHGDCVVALKASSSLSGEAGRAPEGDGGAVQLPRDGEHAVELPVIMNKAPA